MAVSDLFLNWMRPNIVQSADHPPRLSSFLL